LANFGQYELISSGRALNAFFDHMVDVERIKVGKRQTVDTLICEEALLFAKFLRREKDTWIPRLVAPCN
jgi:hypothetical protein